MRINGEPIAQFLQFWKEIPPQDAGELTPEWAANVADQIRQMPDDVIEALTEVWTAAEAQAEASLASVRSRASNLLLAVGILSGLGAVTATASGGLPWPLALPIWVSSALVAFFALGTSWLAIRAQQVRSWSEPHLPPAEGSSLRNVLESRAADVYIADRRNRLALADVVGYLRSAQAYALLALASLLLMALATVATAPFRPSSEASSPASVAPRASPAASAP